MTPTIVWIRDGVGFTTPAASAFVRANAQVRDEFGRDIDVNSTYRDWDTQMAWHRESVAYENGTGPYPGHSWAVHPSQSFHVAGEALDSDDWVHARIVEILADNGFIRNRLYVPGEQHHFEYIQARDKFYGQPAGLQEEDDMYTDADRARDDRVAADVTWLKDRLGGSVKKGDSVTDNIRWIKNRIGGASSTTSLTDFLRSIRDKIRGS